MKRFISILISASMLLGYAVFVKAAPSSFLGSDDFGSFEVGTDYVEHGSMKEGTTTGAAIIGNDGNGNYLSINSQGVAGDTGFAFSDLNVTGKISIVFDYYFEGDGTGARVYFYGSDKSQAAQWGQAGCLMLSEKLKYYVSGAAERTTTISLAKETWHRLSVVYDTSTDTMSIYSGSQCLFAGIPCRVSASGAITKVKIFTSANEKDKDSRFKIKNVSLYNGVVLPDSSVVAVDDFSGYASGVDYISTASPYKTGTDTGVLTIGNDGGGNYLEVDTTSAVSENGFQIPDLSLSGKVTVSMDYMLMSDVGARIHLYGVENHPTEYDQTVCLQMSSPPSNLGYRAAPTYIGKTIHKNNWIKITVVFDTAADTIDVYAGNSCIGKALPARTASGGAINRIRIFSSQTDAEKGAHYRIKNIAVYNKEVVPVVKAIAKDDFANYNVDDDYFAVGALKQSSTENIAIIQNDDDGRGNYLRFDVSGSDGNNGFGFNNVNISGKVTLTMDYMLEQGSTTGVRITLSGKDKSQAMQYGQSGQVQYSINPICYGSQAKPNPTGKYISSGMWIKMTLVYDTLSDTLDIYAGTVCIGKNLPARVSACGAITAVNIYVYQTDAASGSKYRVQNVVLYDGEVIPESTVETPTRQLVDITDSIGTINSSLSDNYAMVSGYPIVYSNGVFELVNENDKLAPILFGGYIYAPADYVAKAMGGSFSGGTITANGISKTFAAGTATDVSPAPPKEVSGVLYIPVCNELISAFNSSAYIDERGIVIFGKASSPGEEVLKNLLFEIRSQSSVFSKSINSEVLFTSRGFYLDDFDGKGNWGTLDAAKRFMSTSMRWTYSIGDVNVPAMKAIGGIVQPTLNPNPSTRVFNEDGTPKMETVNGKDYGVYVATAISLEGSQYIRSYDGLGGWGCVNIPQLYTDILNRAKKGIDEGQYLWQVDDYGFNAGYLSGCFCDQCMTKFQEYLEENYKYVSDLKSYDNRIWDYIENVLGVSIGESFVKMNRFDFRQYLDYIGVDTNAEFEALSNGTTNIALPFKYFKSECVIDFLTRLKADMDAYAASKGLKLSWFHNNTDFPRNYSTSTNYYDVFDGGMGETQDMYMGAGAVYADMLIQNLYGQEYVISNMPKYEQCPSMQLFAGSMPLAYATGQGFLVPWDTWLYGSTRYYTELEELGGAYTFVREHPYLFDHYEAPQKIGYVFDLGTETTSYMHSFAETLLRKGIPAKALPHKYVSSSQIYYLEFDESDLQGVDGVVIVNCSNLTTAETAALTSSGLSPVSYTYTADDALRYRSAEESSFTARISGMPENIYAVLNQHNIDENAPVVVHAINYNSKVLKNVTVEINNAYLPDGENLKAMLYSPLTHPQSVAVSKGASITTITIPELNKWSVLQISTDSTESQAKFDVDGLMGIGLGSRVSFDSAKGTQDSFTINSYGEGINTYTLGDTTGSQDEGGYVYKRIDSDVFEISAALEATAGERGLMIREGVHSNAAFAALIYDNENGLRLVTRLDTNGGVSYTTLIEDKPEYMKITYDNGVVTAYVSPDASIWTKIGTINTFFKAETVGVYASGDDGSLNTCSVSDLSIADSGKRYKYQMVSKNLLSGRNPDFRFTPLTDAVIGFRRLYSSATGAVIADSPFGDGAAFRMTDRADGNAAPYYTYLPVENGKTYEASVWAKTVSGTDTLSVIAENASGGTITLEVVSDGTSQITSDQWTRCYVRFKVSDSGNANGINLRYTTASATDIIIDSVDLREVKTIDNYNLTFTQYQNRVTFDISTRDGSAVPLRLMLVVKEKGTDNVERMSYYQQQTITASDKTQSVTFYLKEADQISELYVWEADSFEPIIRNFKIKSSY